MDRGMTMLELHGEVDALIRLHRKGLYKSRGYQDRRRQIVDFVRRNNIDLRAELDPISYVLYQRYIG